MKITKATVILNNATDHIILETDLPCPFVAAFLPSQPPLTLRFEATFDTGADYCCKVLNIDPIILNTRS